MLEHVHCSVSVAVKCKTGMPVIAGSSQVKFFLVEMIENFSLYSKELVLGQDVLRYSSPDRIMAQSGSKISSNHCLKFLLLLSEIAEPKLCETLIMV